MKKYGILLLLSIAFIACQPSTDEADEEQMTEEEIDRQVEDQLEEDQQRYDSMKRELGL